MAKTAKLKTSEDQQKSSPTFLLVSVGIALGVAAGIVAPDSAVEFAERKFYEFTSVASDKAAGLGLNPNCDIKGNISVDTGERIYHLPGQEFYTRASVRPDQGERWFCTEEAAVAAGWRKAEQ
ncbi:MAG: succinoglycan biosynthesis protein exoi [Rhizobiaceae bacterium]